MYLGIHVHFATSQRRVNSFQTARKYGEIGTQLQIGINPVRHELDAIAPAFLDDDL
jgi:hypothetical protein